MDNDTLRIMAQEAEDLKVEIRNLSLKIEAEKAKLGPIEQILVAYGYQQPAFDEIEPEGIPYTDRLREYVNNYRGVKATINNREFENWLKESHPGSEINTGSLSTAWRMLVNAGELKKVQRGNRHRPAVYAIIDLNCEDEGDDGGADEII